MTIPNLSLPQGALLFFAAALAGAINSVAGGGTMLTFPTLLSIGLASTAANATNTVALWPGALSSLFGLRDEIKQARRTLLPLSVIGLMGGIGGAVLLIVTPETIFSRLVPYLVLGATFLFMAQEPITRWQKARAAARRVQAVESASGDSKQNSEQNPDDFRLTPGVALFLLAVAIYGGYFGAGIGILTLAAFGLLGMTDIHKMNAIKAVFTGGVNGVAAMLFIGKGIVDGKPLVEGKIALLMALGAIFGGYAGAGVARRIGQKNVRRIVVAIGLLMTAKLLFFPNFP